MMNAPNQSEAQKTNFVYFMTQIKSRNLDFQNILFKINWSVFVSVSFSQFPVRHTFFLKFSLLDFIDYCDVFGDHLAA